MSGETDNAKDCTATLWHGPGHQSRTRCEVRGPHDIHRATYGPIGHYDTIATWRGGDATTGFFDEPPSVYGDD